VTGVRRIRRQVPVSDYLRLQTRFAHLFGDPGHPDVVARLQRQADRSIAHFGLLEEGRS
jgi:pyruvate ferredoxin oxidoreductase beta subunit